MDTTNNRRKLIMSLSIALVVLIAFFSLYSILTGRLSRADEAKWDGVSVSTSFSSGNGTKDNPYIIKSGADLAYFKKVIEGDNEYYKDKYYALGNDIDLDYKDFESIGDDTNKFNGYLDGKGYKISNLKITSKTIKNIDYYSLINNIEEADIRNINFSGVEVVPNSDNNIIVSILSNNIVKSNINNISINNSKFNLTNTTKDENNNISGFITNVDKDSEVNNIYFHASLVSEYSDNIARISYSTEGKMTNIYSYYESGLLLINNIDSYIVNKSDAVDNKINSLNDINNVLDKFSDDEYEFIFENEEVIINKKEEVVNNSSSESNSKAVKGFGFSIVKSPAITLHDSGKVGNTVYINDLNSDLNYYKGLNYTESTTWPSGNSSNKYNTSGGLAKVYIAYKGSEINANSTVVGYVSLNEQYSDFVYYKYYPIENGYVTIPLIDNPYADRPNDRAFNGWVTDYEGAEVSLDVDTYTRYVKVPAQSEINITMYASWTEATTVNSINNNALKSVGMQRVVTDRTPIFDTPTLYRRNSMSSGYNGTRYPNGALDENGNSLNGQYCNGYYTTCYYYTTVDLSTISEGQNYFELKDGVMTTYTVPAPVDYNLTSFMDKGDSLAGYFKQVTVTGNGSRNGLYNSTGVMQSGNGNGTYYQLVQNPEEVLTVDNYDQYYYLVTRDTNIVSLTGNVTAATTSKPLTITGLNNNTLSTGCQVTTTRTQLHAGADLRVEYCTIRTNTASHSTSGPSGSGSNQIRGYYYNLKIGRGISNYTSGNNRYYTASSVIGGGNGSTGSSGNPTKYSLIVESGYYNTISAVSTTGNNNNVYTQGMATYGSDFDRISNDNSNLEVYYNIAGTNGGYVRSGSTNVPFIKQTVKSGIIGEANNTAASGIYAGGLSGGTIYSPSELIVEGGDIYNVNGGPLIDSSLSNNNVIFINIKGGEVDNVFGGAALTETYGNRIISLTGGKVNGSVFGGSNGIEGTSNNVGTLSGNTFIYAGGSVEVGDTERSEGFFGAEVGSIFGSGNGRSGYTGIGSVNNSRVIIDVDASINGNVYGGGNFGSPVSKNGTTTIDIKMLGGEVSGSIYGGGNNNGAGSTSHLAYPTITVTGGTIDKSVYGGSRTNGVIYGDTNVNILSGTVKSNVYGGGEGGYTDRYNRGTYVSGNVEVTIGNSSSGPTVRGNVYGGSAFGTVNGTAENENANTKTVNVNVNSGTITGNVFGGGQGDDEHTPKEYGNVTVTIDGGNISNVFGGNDLAGRPAGTDRVLLNGGIIGNVYGGGNKTGQDTTNVYLRGSTLTGDIFGGSNETGTVTTTNVYISSGEVRDVFGGNNLGGFATTTNVTVTIADEVLKRDVYGGGYQAGSGNTNVTINNGELNDVYGGGNQAGVNGTAKITVNNGRIDHLFGGSNNSGQVAKTVINVENSYAEEDVVKEVDTELQLTDNGAYWDDGSLRRVTIKPVIRNYSDQDYSVWTANVTIPGSTFFREYLNSPLSRNGETYTFTQENKYDRNIPFVVPAHGEVEIPGYFEVFVPISDDYEINFDIVAEKGDSTTSFSGSYLNGKRQGDPLRRGINYIYGGNNLGGTTGTSSITVEAGNIGEIYGGGNKVGITTTNVNVTGGDVLSVYGGSNETGNVTTSNVTIGGSNVLNITDVYGGNNKGGKVDTTNVSVTKSNITNLYGGGNNAPVGNTHLSIGNGTIENLYGGGNAAEVTGNTYLDVDSAVIPTNLFGGGNNGAVLGNTEVYVTDSNVGGSIYAGGNGASAVVHGNTLINIDGKTVVGSSSTTTPNGSVFGGGNAAATGEVGSTTSTATVNIVGGEIYGNVYGGANTSIVYGKTFVNIGTEAVNNSDLEEDDIYIHGTVFGGGESNASGSDTFDWNFISVTDSIDIVIDGSGYETNSHTFKLTGSIFGSGNASSSKGDSSIYIKKLGSYEDVSRNVSIQRTDKLTIDNSWIELSGIEDSTNDYSDIKYTFNQINLLILKNNSTLLLKKNANLLKELYSGVDVDGELVPAKVTVNTDGEITYQNVDNRIYMIPDNNLNVTTNQAATTYGRITGMTFFGMYNSYAGGSLQYGMYDKSFQNGDEADASDLIIGGSYVLGRHLTNHDITVNGFYSNYLNDDRTAIKTDYVGPSEIGENGYRWIIGQYAINYQFTLTASKYSSLGTHVLSMYDFSKGDTKFKVLGFNSEGLAPEVDLVDPLNVPKLTETEEEANRTLGLAMKSETHEWTNYQTTKYTNEGNGKVYGDINYRTDSQALSPQLMFYFYHAKNISLDQELGTVVIMMEASEPLNAIEDKVSLVTITITLEAKEFDYGDNYDASISYGKKYEMPTATDVNITNQSQFSTYFSLFAKGNEIDDIYGLDNTYYHSLVTDYVLPVGTQITMIDYGIDDTNPNFYYYTVDQASFNRATAELATDNQVSYKLSDFIKMGSTSTDNKYNDKTANEIYYDESHNRTIEEFMFIFDFKETNQSGTHEDNHILFELRNNEDRSMLTVLGIRQDLMVYNLYDSGNTVLKGILNNFDGYLYQNRANTFNYVTSVGYQENESRSSIIDTNYESSPMGINVSLIDASGEQVSSSLLTGTTIKIDNKYYFADSDGVWRINLSGKVSNLNKNVELITDTNLHSGNYKIRITLFASSDGKHNSNPERSHTIEVPLVVVGDENAIKVTAVDKTKVVDGKTSLNENKENTNKYNVKIISVLEEPKLKVEIYKRKTDNDTTTEFSLVPFNKLFKDTFDGTANQKELAVNPEEDSTYDFVLADNLTSGTYKVVFELYDGDYLVDSDYEYVIVTKPISE